MKVRSWALGVHGLSLLFTTWAYVWFLIYAANENAPLFRTLHAAEKNYASGSTTHVPRSYFTLDWIMHPAVDSDEVKTVPVLSGGHACQANGPGFDKELKSCSPQKWQTTDVCKASSTTITDVKAEFDDDAKEDELIKQLYRSDETHKENMQLCSGSTTKLCWPAPTMKDACRMERIGEYMVFENDINSFSLASAHSSDLLLAGAAATLWIVNAYALINYYMYNVNDDAQMRAKDRARALKLVLAFGALLAPVIVRLATTQSKVVDTVHYHNMLPNGSYFYVIVSIFWASAISFYDICFCKEKREPQTAEVMTQEMEQIKDMQRIPGTEPAERGIVLDTSSFYSKKRLSVEAYMARSAPTAKENKQTLRSYDPGFIFTENSFDFSSTEIREDYMINFELAQLFTFPLIILSVFVHYNNYEIDSRLQMLFVAAVGYSLLDIFGRRIILSGVIYDALCGNAADEPRINTVQLNLKSEMANIRDVLKSCCACDVLKVCHVLTIALQLLFAVVIFFCMRWHLALGSWGARQENALVDSWRRELTLDYAGFAFVFYVLFCTLAKFLYVFYSNKIGHAANKTFLLTLFFAFVVFNVVIMAESHNDRVNGLFEFQKYRIKAFADTPVLQNLVSQYSAGWVKAS